ncbi:uncharacterized protein LOC126665683 [Mercurialis annua]|uniref:uncharacterized protein LOC126657517 n=1 Tax=Mercurialis annua TaxID=3986 RepID=UPI0024AD4344|nr:uncharacterized protein LOC126657517 [Mercurialis annua]XP_050208182.2 uncharacterized protein LOC126657520 [Mercurialis annua]XP_050214508.2 uncharacterized protein LOC126665683 [Mercurialis annua]
MSTLGVSVSSPSSSSSSESSASDPTYPVPLATLVELSSDEEGLSQKVIPDSEEGVDDREPEGEAPLEDAGEDEVGDGGLGDDEGDEEDFVFKRRKGTSGTSSSNKKPLSEWTISLGKEALVWIRARYEIPPFISLRIPSEGSAVSQVLKDDEQLLFVEDFEAGLRLPLDLFTQEVFDNFKIPLGQLHPNAHRHLTGVFIRGLQLKRQVGYEIVRAIYSLGRKKSDEFFYLQPGRSPFTGLPNSLKRWKGNFVIAKKEGGWGSIPNVFVEGPLKLEKANLSEVDKETLRLLRGGAKVHVVNLIDSYFGWDQSVASKRNKRAQGEKRGKRKKSEDKRETSPDNGDEFPDMGEPLLSSPLNISSMPLSPSGILFVP